MLALHPGSVCGVLMVQNGAEVRGLCPCYVEAHTARNSTGYLGWVGISAVSEKGHGVILFSFFVLICVFQIYLFV